MPSRFLFALLLACLPLMAAEVEQNETIQKNYSLSSSAPKKIIVDNVNGSIHVTGYDGSEVRLVAHKRLRADSPEKAEEARRDIRLDISQNENTVRFYVDGPFRCRDGGVHIDRDPGYEVKYDFEVQVPRDTATELKTVNDGEIKVDGVSGDYKVVNINGGVEMTELSGSGKVYALNGKVNVTFRENPRDKSSFGSLNGEVRVSFQPDFNADVRSQDLQRRRVYGLCRKSLTYRRRWRSASGAAQSLSTRAASGPRCVWAGAGRSSVSTHSTAIFEF